jgi:hypothetical protein
VGFVVGNATNSNIFSEHFISNLPITIRRRGTAGLVTMPRTGRPNYRGCDFTSGTDLPLLQNIQTGSGVQQTSYPIRTPGDHSSTCISQVKNTYRSISNPTYVFRCIPKIAESDY